MKAKILTMLLAAVCLLGGSAAARAEKKPNPGIEFAQKEYDFGTFKEEKGYVSHEFEFTNTGNAPLLILSASASCGCTRPDYPTHPVKPGKSGKIKVTYNPAGRPGEFTKTITVRTNVKGKGKKVTLKIRGNVIPKK